MSASQWQSALPSAAMGKRTNRELGPYLPITEDLQRDIKDALQALNDQTQRWLAEKADVDPGAISQLLDPRRVGKTSRVIKRVCAVLKIPLPRAPTDADGAKLARLQALNPTVYRYIKGLIDEFFDAESKKP